MMSNGEKIIGWEAACVVVIVIFRILDVMNSLNEEDMLLIFLLVVVCVG